MDHKSFLPILAAATLLAGCASAPQEAATTNATTSGASADAAASAAPWHSKGTVWLKPQQGQEPAKLELPFVVNASGMLVTATLRVGEKYGPAELPTSTSSEDAQLVDAAGTVLAKASRQPGGPVDMKLEGKGAAVGAGKLVVLYRGGSDEGQGGGFGDYIAFTIDAK